MSSSNIFVDLNEAFKDIESDFRFQVFMICGEEICIQHYVVKAVSYEAAKVLLVSFVPDLDGFIYLAHDPYNSEVL